MTESSNSSPTLNFFVNENELGNIDLYGSVVGIADGEVINFLLTDDDGNSKTVSAVITGGEFSLSNVWAGMFGEGLVNVVATAGGIEGTGEVELSGNQLQAPVTLTSNVLDANLMIDVQGQAPGLEPGTVLTLVIRDEQNNEVTAEAEVMADGSFSVQDIDTLGLSEGVLRFDVVAQDANGVLNLPNIASLVLTGNGPQGADNTLNATEDTAYVVNAAAFGYDSSQGHTLTGIKITSLPAQGTLKLNGNVVQVDDVISKADIDAGKLTYQGALNGNGSNYASFLFKVQDSRDTNNEDTTANKLTFNVAAVNDAAIISGPLSGAVVEAGGAANAAAGTPTTTGTLTSTDVDGVANAFTAVTTAAASANGYGTYTMTAGGVWTYTLDNTKPAVQALVAGATLTDTFTVAAADGTSKVVTVTITGSNDAAVISGAGTGAVTEAGSDANANAIAGTPSATGTLTATDVDGTANAFTPVTAGTATTGGYGTYAMTAAGVWTYTLNNSNAAVQALTGSQTLTDTFTVTAADGTSKVVSVTITGSNDAAFISGTSTGAVTEAGGVNNGTAGTPTATGTLTSTDVDGAASAFTAVTAGAATTGGYGTYAMTAGGVWTYTLNNTNATVQALAAGATLTDTFTVTAADGTNKVVSVTINGTNDAAVVGGTSTGSVTEAGGVANATAGTPTATGTLTSTDVDGTPNAFTAVTTATASTGGHGSYTMTTAGVWTYTLDNTKPAVQALAAGATLTDTFTVTAADGTAKVVTVTINGTNDAAVVGGTSTGAVTEAGGVANGTAGTPSATGTLSATDVDGTPNAFTAVTTATASTGGHGSYTMTAAGVWTYTLDNTKPAVQALVAGATLTDTFTVTAADGTAKVVTVTINGTNDAATISGSTTGAVTEAGGAANAIAGTPTATGTLTSTDVDGTPNTFMAVTTATASTGGHGTYTMTAGGVWTYTLDNTKPAVQALVTGATLTDTFTVAAADGTSKVVTVTITGSNDAAVISGAGTGAVTEAGSDANANAIAGTPSATGTLTATDVDGTANAFTPVTAGTATTGGYGTYAMTAAGVWTYTLNNSNAAVQALTGSQTLTDTFTVTAADGTSKVVSVTITGSNDAAFISGTSTGAVTEAGGVNNGTAGTPTATGTLTSTDVDGAASAFTAVTAGAATTGGYGTYAMTAGGVWTYTLNNTNATVQALAAGATLTDTFTVTAADGTNKVVSVTINGTNDAAVVGGTSTGSVTEAGGVANATAGTPTATGTLTSTDVDGTPNAFTAVTTATASTGGHGSYTMTTAGVWTYTLDNTKPAVQALAAGATLTDTFTVTAADGTAKVVTVTINGTNDAAVVGGTSTGAVTEAGGVANGTAGTPSATGTLSATDVDGTPNAFTAVTTATASTGGHGSYTMTAAGVWTYTLDNTKPAVQALVAGATLTDTFTVTAADGTAKVVTVTINGTNDAATISGSTTGAVTEAGGAANAIAGTPTATGTLTSTDVDGTPNTFMAVTTATASTGGHGTYTMTAGGVWTYTLDNTKPAVQALVTGATLTDTFTVAAADGTSKVVTVTITGSNDAAVISGAGTGAVTEAGSDANANAIAGTPSATGTLTATDVDGTANAFTPVTAGTATTGGYGTYAMTAAGVWTYTLNNSNAAVQALTGSQTLTDTFTVTAADGTSKVVSVTINGTNDAALISGTSSGALIEAGGVANFLAGTPTATGTLTSTDVDGTPNTFTAVTAGAASTSGYGTYTMTAAGVWTYTLDNTKPAVQALVAGATLTDTFTVTAADGTAKVVTVTINGTNDAAVVGGTSTGAVTEAGGVANAMVGAPSATGTLTATDVDGAPNTFIGALPGTVTTGGYGTYAMTTSGVWNYMLNNNNATVQALSSAQTLIDSFTVTAADGTAQVVSVTINGTNDAAVISGTSSGALTEAGGLANAIAGTPTATGTLTSTDVDGTPNTFTAVTAGAASTSGYGTYTMTAAGVWTYTLDNTKPAVQALVAGATLTDTFTVTAADGTAKLVTVTINGTNDAAVVGGISTGAVTEAGGAANAIAGTPTATGTLTSTDVDGTPNAFTAVTTATASTGGHGSYTMTAAGAWTYTLDNTKPAVQALAAGATLTDTFTVTAADGTAKVVSVTITGTNDAPVVALAIPDQTAILGTAFSYTIPAGSFTDTDSTLTLTATREDGSALPAWLTFNAATRTFSGTPNSTADFNVKVTASDGTASISDTFVLGVAPVANTVAIVSATGAQNNLLNAGDSVTATVNFSEIVTVTGTPQLKLNIGGVLVNANYVSGSGTSALTFSYAILPGQTDANGVSIDSNPLVLNGGTIKDALGNNATLNLAAVTDNASFKVDTAAPTLSGLQIVSAVGAQGGFLNKDDTLSIKVDTSEAVIVNGVPTLDLVIGSTTVQATYDAANSTSTQLAFTYKILGGQTDINGISIPANAIKLGAGVTVTDAAGNSANLVTALVADNISYKVDTSAPAPLTVVLAIDTGSSTTDKVSQTGALKISGAEGSFFATTGTVLTPQSPGALSGGTLANQTSDFAFSLFDGNWISAFNLPTTGTDGMRAHQTSASFSSTLGNTNTDLSAPLSLPTNTTADFVYSSAAGKWIYQGSVGFQGVEYSVDGGAYTSAYVAPTSQGSHTVQVRQSDAAGNTSVATAITFNVDTIAPVAVADIKNSDEDTTPITGNVSSNDTSKDGSESYAIVGSPTGTYGTLTMNANGTYSYARSVVLDQIQTTAVETFTYKVTDAAGNTTQSTLTINMAPVNDAAVVGGDLVKTVSETNAALTVTGALTITDVDSAQTFNALSGVVGTYGSFSMTTAGAWTYVMSSAQDQFKAGTAYNDVFTVTTADNTTKTVTVTINGTNDGPVLVSTNQAFSDFYENGGAVSAKKGSIVLSDIDSDNFQGATVSVIDFLSNGFITGDVLTWTLPSGAVISGNYNTSTGVLTFTGSATKAQYEQLLNSVMFNNLREDVIGGARKVYWTVTDTSGQQSSTSVYSTVSVNRLNDAPVLGDTNLSLGTVQTTSSVVAPTGNVGVLVSSLVGGITDIDGSTAVKGIAVTKVNQALGQLYFSINGGTNWYTYSTAITLSEQAALLLKADATTRVYFRPHVGVEGTMADAMTIRAWDTTDNKVTLNGAQVSLYNVSATGGTTAYSVASDTVALTVASTATAGFEGTSGTNLLMGTAGNDVMVGNGGIDQINAGAGNDKVVLNASNVSTLSAVNTGVINGNAGINTLKLSGTDMLLDFSLAAVQSKVDNFSVLDITGTGNNTLKLNMLNLQTLSGAADNINTAGVNESQMLVVHGDSGDAVILENAASWTVSNSLLGSTLSSTYGADYGFITGSPIRKYTQYTKDGVTLFVDDATAVADMVGTSGADVLTGTANADVIYGNGGADQIQAGAGNDVVILNVNSVATLAASNSAVVNGGAGVNSLKLSGFNNTLDLTNATVSGKVDNFSVIDLRQGNGNKVKINLQDVLDLSGAVDNLTTVGVDESRMLVVQGNGGTITNAVQLVDSVSWTKVTNLGGTTMINTYGAQYGFEVGRSYTQYTNGLANLFVDQSLGQTLL
jgi:VCBS repeat-containing protein